MTYNYKKAVKLWKNAISGKYLCYDDGLLNQGSVPYIVLLKTLAGLKNIISLYQGLPHKGVSYT